VADFARRLRADGLIVHQDHGTSAHRLDLAVEDPRRPHRMLLAVETDGPGYAAMRSTRDRDRLRIEQLQRLGWQHVRVWTTDLFRDPAQDVSRVIGLVRAASDAERSGAAASAVGGPGEPGPDSGPSSSRATGTADEAGASSDTGGTREDGTTGRREADMTEGAAAAGEPAPASKPATVVQAEQTTDDTDAGWGERTDDRAHDEWLREQRPPHWG
jgi:very-short-patch-repair endonuclease